MLLAARRRQHPDRVGLFDGDRHHGRLAGSGRSARDGRRARRPARRMLDPGCRRRQSASPHFRALWASGSGSRRGGHRRRSWCRPRRQDGHPIARTDDHARGRCRIRIVKLVAAKHATGRLYRRRLRHVHEIDVVSAAGSTVRRACCAASRRRWRRSSPPGSARQGRSTWSRRTYRQTTVGAPVRVVVRVAGRWTASWRRSAASRGRGARVASGGLAGARRARHSSNESRR